LNDLGDDLSAASVLGLRELRLLLTPLVVSPLQDQGVYLIRLTLDLFDEERDELINCILVIVQDGLERGSRRLLHVRHAVLLQGGLLIRLNLLNEALLLLVQQVLQLQAELGKLGCDALKGFRLQTVHIFVDLLDFSEVLIPGHIQSLLKRHLDVQQVTLECQNEIGELVFLRLVVVRVISAIILVSSFVNVA